MPYIGEIRPVGFNFAPVNWLPCDGRLLPISEYQTLYALLGTTYGGDGQNTFALPDLRGRVPLHMGTLSGTSYVLGQVIGSESGRLTTSNMPTHAHSFSYQPVASGNAGSQTSPQNVYYAGSGRSLGFSTIDTSNAVMATPSVQTSSAGGTDSISLAQPYQVVNYVIAVFGIFPSTN